MKQEGWKEGRQGGREGKREREKGRKGKKVIERRHKGGFWRTSLFLDLGAGYMGCV